MDARTLGRCGLAQPSRRRGPVGKEVERRMHCTPEALLRAIDNLRGTQWLWLVPFRQGTSMVAKPVTVCSKRSAPPFASRTTHTIPAFVT